MNLTRKMFCATLCLILPAAAAAQQDWETPRTPDGQPDLQGVWTNSSQTPLVRPEEFGTKGFLTREEAQDVEEGPGRRDGTSGRVGGQRAHTGTRSDAIPNHARRHDTGRHIRRSRRDALTRRSAT